MKGFFNNELPPSILFDQANHSLKWKETIGARIREGSPHPYFNKGLGDSVLLDLRHGFFAITDSSPRNSDTGRSFLRRFSKILNFLPAFNARNVYSAEEIKEIAKRINRECESVLRSVPFEESATFTGVLIVKGVTGLRGILFHSGDSFFFHVHPSIGLFQQISENNIWMVGRTSRLFQVMDFEIMVGAVLILATDGFCDLDFATATQRSEFVIRTLRENSVENVPDALMKNIERRDGNLDDFGVIAIRPEKLLFNNSVILI